jgi:hypothetical protein
MFGKHVIAAGQVLAVAVMTARRVADQVGRQRLREGAAVHAGGLQRRSTS